MNEYEIQISRDIHALMNAISELTKVSLDPDGLMEIARETNDIELAYTQLGRLVSRARAARHMLAIAAE
jgi:YD repeat-containing protein